MFATHLYIFLFSATFVIRIKQHGYLTWYFDAESPFGIQRLAWILNQMSRQVHYLRQSFDKAETPPFRQYNIPRFRQFLYGNLGSDPIPWRYRRRIADKYRIENETNLFPLFIPVTELDVEVLRCWCIADSALASCFGILVLSTVSSSTFVSATRGSPSAQFRSILCVLTSANWRTFWHQGAQNLVGGYFNARHYGFSDPFTNVAGNSVRIEVRLLRQMMHGPFGGIWTHDIGTPWLTPFRPDILTAPSLRTPAFRRLPTVSSDSSLITTDSPPRRVPWCMLFRMSSWFLCLLLCVEA